MVVAKVMGDKAMAHRRLAAELPRQIRTGLARLARLQHDDGGWGWWLDDPSHPFMTAYVVQGLATAKRLGHPVDENMFSKGVNRLKALSRSSKLGPTQRVYLLYSLALADVKYPAMLEKLKDQPEGLTEYGKALLAMAMLELGMREQAMELSGQLDLVSHKTDSGAHWGDEAGMGWASDPVESTAAVLRALLATRPDSAQVESALRYLMAARQGSRWHSTRDTSMAIFALVDYLKKFGAKKMASSIEVQFNGQARPARKISADDVFKPSIRLFEQLAAKKGENKYEVGRDGQGVFYVDASLSFFSRADPIPAQGGPFLISRTLRRVIREPSGEGFKTRLQAIRGPVSPGDLILVTLDLSTSRDAEFIMVSDPFPAGSVPVERDAGYKIPGLELVQARMHRAFHDDHVAFFLTRMPKGKRRLGYLLRATVPGQYRMLPARVQPMYDPQFAGNSAGDSLTVELSP